MCRLPQALVGWGSPPGPELAHGPMGRSAFGAGWWASWSAFDEAAVYTGQHPTAYPDFQDLSSPVPAIPSPRPPPWLSPPQALPPAHMLSGPSTLFSFSQA